MSAPHADRDHSEQPGLTGDRKAATGFRCCVHCKDDVAYHEDNAPDSHDAECTLCTQALARRAVADAVVAAGVDADEVTRLRAERTPGVWPTPEQFVAEWDALTREQQIAQAERIIDGVQRGSRCFQENHYRRIPDLEAKVARLRAGIREVNLAAAAEGRSRDAAEAERDRLAEVVARVEVLHRVTTVPATTGLCAAEECDHDDECPTEDVAVCAACWDFATGIDSYYGEGGIADVMWPCATVAALSGGPSPAEAPHDGPEPALSREQGTSGQSVEGEALRGAEKGVPGIGDTCCGKCPGGTCYVDGVTGA